MAEPSMVASSVWPAWWRAPVAVSPGASPPLVVLFHGRGGNENDMELLAHALPADALVASVRAPLGEAPGYSWFLRHSVGRAVAASLRSALDGFWRDWFDTLDLRSFDRRRVYVVGFSSGAMMAAALILDRPAAIAGAALVHGPVPFDAALELTEGRLVDRPVLVSYDADDPAIPTAQMVQSIDYLQSQSGARVTVAQDSAGHALTPSVVATIVKWISLALSNSQNDSANAAGENQ